MDNEKILIVLNQIIDSEARTTVGMLCKRVELLQKNESLSPSLFKEISKEIIYEQSRTLKKLINISFLPKVIFISKKSKEK